MRQSVLRDFPNEISGHLRILSICATVLIVSSMSEASNVVADSNIRDISTNLGNITREVTAADSSDVTNVVNICRKTSQVDASILVGGGTYASNLWDSGPPR